MSTLSNAVLNSHFMHHMYLYLCCVCHAVFYIPGCACAILRALCVGTALRDHWGRGRVTGRDVWMESPGDLSSTPSPLHGASRALLQDCWNNKHKGRSQVLKVLVTTIYALDKYSTVGGDGGWRVGKVRAGTTSPMPDHKSFKLQSLSEIQPLPFFLYKQNIDPLTF